jgi:hypothetical protein
MREESSESLSLPVASSHRISLVDQTKPTTGHDADSADSDLELSSPVTTNLSKRVSIREQANRWKYTSGRYTAERAGGSRSAAGGIREEQDGEGEDEAGLDESTWGMNAFERGRQHLHNKLHAQRRFSKTVNDPGTETDVLYENQRGGFLFGIPLFSANALWPKPIDIAAWTDDNMHKSLSNITNAQVPDPSWIWVWKNWYVDMGGDVDEEGWEYSFMFKGFSWHGRHTWFHSFVRRRRWLRKRARKPDSRLDKVFGNAHMMNQDYFTIHAESAGLQSPTPEYNSASVRTGQQWGMQGKEPWEDREIRDIATLLQGLREAPVDSQRITLIRRFLDQGGDDLIYLADEVCAFIFLNLLKLIKCRCRGSCPPSSTSSLVGGYSFC